MKAFRFRLDQVLHWRANQLDIEKARLSAAASHLASLRDSAAALQTALDAAEASRTSLTTGSELVLWHAWDTRTRASLTVLESQQREARATIEKCRLAVVEADRRLRLLQNLRKSDHASWTAAWNRELEAFAAESFLGKLQLENGRARSSAG